MKKTAFILMILTILSKILGFAREIALSYFYGASSISDAYLISLTVPMVIFSFIGTGIITGYIPMYNNVIRDFGEKEGNKFTNNLINILLIICTILIIIGLFFTRTLVGIFASGFTGETLNLAIKFTRVSLIGVYFSGVIYILSGYLQIKDNYFIPALIAFPSNIIIILSIFISKNTNIMILIIGSVIATASQLLFIIPFVKKKGFRYSFILNIKDKHIKTMAYIASPVIIGVSVNQINTLVDRTMASRLAVGGISALNYSNKLNGFIQGLFVMSIATVMYPMISKMAAEKDMKGLKKFLLEAIGAINLLVIPATVGSMIFAEPVVRLLFGRGAFDTQAISMTSYSLFFYSMGMIGFGLREVISRAFYALQDTKTPMINAAISMVINIGLNIILSKFLGIGGLALATSISAIFCTGLLFISLRKKIGSFGMKDIIISSGKILFSSLAMGVIAKITYNFLLNHISINLSLVLAIGIGLFVYLIIIYFMKIEDVEVVINTLKRKVHNKKVA